MVQAPPLPDFESPPGPALVRSVLTLGGGPAPGCLVSASAVSLGRLVGLSSGRGNTAVKSIRGKVTLWPNAALGILDDGDEM